MDRKAGLAPGTVVYFGERKAERVTIRLMDYGPESFREDEPGSVEDCLASRDTATVSWINVDGLHDTEILQRLCGHFGIHPLVQEDIVNTTQRPKFEDYGDYVYLVCRMMTYDAEARQLVSEQISLVVGKTWVLSFQERQGDVFEPVRERARQGKGRLRRLGPDYLAYALVDAVVDNYFVILEQMGEQIEILEAELLSAPARDHLAAIHAFKREIVLMRRSVWPLREVVGAILREESALMEEATRFFFRDLYDHTIQVADAVDSLRDILSSLQDLYLSSVSNRMNEVMKVLTIMGSVFIPLTFVAGIYGMNFAHMPELAWRWSYPLFWLVILGLAGALVTWFRRRGWL
jgi:magnesium transporter